MSKHLVINGTIRLFDWIDYDNKERVTTVAVLPPQTANDWEGFAVNVIDWKISGQTVKITYQLHDDLYAPILDAVLPIRVDRMALRPPTKSKHWELREFSNGWFNRKTGERVALF